MSNPYLDKISSYWRDRPNYRAVVDGLTQPFQYLQEATLAIPAAFDLDNAVGVQLDITGQWIGITRNVLVPIQNVYFSFDIEGLGFDQGIWQGPYDPSAGLVQLDDDSYRILLRAKIASNNWDGSLAGAKVVLDDLFGVNSPTLIFIQDNGDESITYGVSGTMPTPIQLALLTNGYLDLKPSTIRIASYQITSVDTAPLFGFDCDNEYIKGFDEGAWGTEFVGDPLNTLGD